MTAQSRVRPTWVALAAACAACGNCAPPNGTDAGTHDAGTHGDAGEARDGGTVDAGSGSDAGTGFDGGATADAGQCAAGDTRACPTSCGSTGTETCSAGAWGSCVPPAEICNLADDDCNGSCDDILGCRIGVDRSYASAAGLHFYTTTDSEASCCGYSVEAYDYYFLYASAQTGLVPFYRCRTTAGAHRYTTDAACGGDILEGQIGWIATGAVCGSVPLYELHNATSGDYLYTMSSAEVTSAEAGGYALAGTSGYVWAASCGGPNCTWASPIHMVGSTTATVTGFPTAWYGFPISGNKTFTSLTGTVTVDNSANLYAEVLFILQYLPSGTCQQGLWPSSTPEYGPPGAIGIGQFIVKAPTQGVFTQAINLTLPGGLPVSNCVLVGLNGGAVSTAHAVTSSVDLSLSFTSQPSTQSLLGTGGEFCFGQNWGCQLATTNDSQSFANVTPIGQTTQLIALYGNISDSTFDGTSSFGAPPAGAWTATNDFYVYHGAECGSFGVTAGVAGPGNYYASIPADANHLLSVPLSGNGIGVQTVQVFQPFTGLTLNARDCLVTLWGLQGGGGFDNETQVVALVAP